ncbi:MAG: hypothetical protein HY747_06135 [Elusimicrobia bacterium]|nr:hypothetical protein [Elusimicrobiota bacterium]
MNNGPISVSLASFALDIPILLPALGYLAGRLSKTGKMGCVLFNLSLLGFWLIAGGLYFDVLSVRFVLGDIGSGNHFMWNSGMEVLGIGPLFPFAESTYRNFWSTPNLVAMALFLFVYPAVLWLGFRKGKKHSN